LIVAVAVMGILAAIAVPSFMSSIRKSRRSEAYSAISSIQLAQERWRANNPQYASSLTAAAPSGLGMQATTPNNYYALSLSGVTATGYTVLAIPPTGSSQIKDGSCAQLSVLVNVGTIYYGSASATGTISYPGSYPSNNPCWNR
jgi:type IV pilus assembly protein PilE